MDGDKEHASRVGAVAGPHDRRLPVEHVISHRACENSDQFRISNNFFLGFLQDQTQTHGVSPALQDVGGSLCRSLSSLIILLRAISYSFFSGSVPEMKCGLLSDNGRISGPRLFRCLGMEEMRIPRLIYIFTHTYTSLFLPAESKNPFAVVRGHLILERDRIKQKSSYDIMINNDNITPNILHKRHLAWN
jgi:hypothetical protein